MKMDSILHSIDSKRITPDHFLACIEIPKGSKNKYELDEESGALILDRILYTSTHYPQNYGFIPKTWGLDEDPLDVLVISSETVVPLSLMRCHPIGVLEMVDSGEVDEKILAVCENDPFYSQLTDIQGVPKHLLDEIKHFFTVYKQLEKGKPTEIGDFKGAERAKEVIQHAIERYQKMFGGK